MVFAPLATIAIVMALKGNVTLDGPIDVSGSRASSDVVDGILAIGTSGDSGGEIDVISTGGAIYLTTEFGVSGGGTGGDGGFLTFEASGAVTVGTASRSL